MSKTNNTKDSAIKNTYSTGAKRSDASGKGDYELISPIFMRRLALVCEAGRMHVGARNWEAGLPVGRYIQSTLRHTEQFLEGMRDEDHLTQAAWNLMAAIHTLEMIDRGLLPNELNDLPNYVGKGTFDQPIMEKPGERFGLPSYNRTNYTTGENKSGEYIKLPEKPFRETGPVG